MKHQSSFEVAIASDPCRLPELRDTLRRWLEQAGWNERQIGEITLAVDEALVNTIKHGYGGRIDQRIEFTVRPIQSSELGAGIEIAIRDYGRQVDPKTICGRDLNDIRPGGLGVHLIKAMMNCATYEQADGGGMRLVMQKYLSHVPSPVTAESDEG